MLKAATRYRERILTLTDPLTAVKKGDYDLGGGQLSLGVWLVSFLHFCPATGPGCIKGNYYYEIVGRVTLKF